MFSIDAMLTRDENDFLRMAEEITTQDLPLLLALLNEKDDKIRYKAFLLTQTCSALSPILYPYWAIYKEKLRSENSYQRSLGAMLIAENAKWDTENRMEETLNDYCILFTDEKPITVRQSIQALKKIIPYHLPLCQKIGKSLMSIDLMSIKETMRKLLLTDILDSLIDIRKCTSSSDADAYIFNALSGGILDKKIAKTITEKLMQYV